MTAPAVRGRTVDLHAHSTASDGSATPTSLVETAAAAGLSAIALTDHDTLDGVAEAREAGVRLGVRVVAGVELSATDGDRETHLLALHLADTHALEVELRRFRETRVTRAVTMVSRLNALGVPVTMEAVRAHAGAGAVGRPHVARAIVDGGWVRDQREAFDRYLGAGRPAFVGKHQLTLADAVRLAHDAGGIAVFAHPGREGVRARIEPMAAAGLDGLETIHPSHSAEDVARLTALAAHFGMIRSGGSDWHGAREGPRVLGVMHVDATILDEQDARVAARAAVGAG